MFDRVLIEAFLTFFGPSIFMGEGKGDEVSFTEEFVPRGNIGFKHSKLFVEEEETFRQLRCVIVLKRIIELQSRLIEEYRTIVSNRVVIELVFSLLFKSQTNKRSFLLCHPPPGRHEDKSLQSSDITLRMKASLSSKLHD